MIESGVGKTIEELIPAVVDCINSGELCILTGTLNSVSNHHVRLLKERLPTSHFEERVRVEGARGRDALSKSMMLDALTWKLMRPAVEQYERRMVPLRKAMIQVVAVEEIGHRIFLRKALFLGLTNSVISVTISCSFMGRWPSNDAIWRIWPSIEEMRFYLSLIHI